MADVFGESSTRPTPWATTAPGSVAGRRGPAGRSLRNMSNPSANGDPRPDDQHPVHPVPPAPTRGGPHQRGVGNRAAVLISGGGTVGGHRSPASGSKGRRRLLRDPHHRAHLRPATTPTSAVALPQACLNLVGDAGHRPPPHCARSRPRSAATEMATDPPQAPAPEAPVCAAGDGAHGPLRGRFENPGPAGNCGRTSAGRVDWSQDPPVEARRARVTSTCDGPDTRPGRHDPDPAADFGDARIRDDPSA